MLDPRKAIRKGFVMTQNEKTTVKKDVEVVESKKVGKSTQVEYVKMSDMSQDDIFKLPKFQANVIKNKSKRGNIFYELHIRLDRVLTITKRLTETDYYLIVGYRGISEEKPIQTIDVWCRFVEGENESTGTWKRYEIYVCKALTISDWFNDKEIALMDVAKINLPFIKSGLKLDTADDHLLDEEELARKYKGIFG